MSAEPVLIACEGVRAHLTLNRPERGNALGAELVDALHVALDACLANGAQLIVLRGAGRHFCPGFDFDGIERQSDGDLLLRFVRIQQLLQKVMTAGAVMLAVGHGRTTGAGADLFAACDIRVAIAGATFLFPGAGFGVVLGSQRLASLVGPVTAQRLICDGHAPTAEEAAAMGLVSQVASEGDLATIFEHALARAQRMDCETLQRVRHATAQPRYTEDLANLVLSASRPGLKARIVQYRNRVQAARLQPAGGDKACRSRDRIM